MAVENTVIRDRVISCSNIHTLLNVSKLTSCKICHCTLKVYFAWCELRNFHLWKISMGCIMPSLVWANIWPWIPLGANLNLGCSVSDLAFCFLVQAFAEGVAHIFPDVRSPRSPWDLSLSALQKPLFDTIWDITLYDLTYKFTFYKQKKINKCVWFCMKKCAQNRSGDL